MYDATGAADIVELTTDSTSWVLLETAFEVPAGCASIEIYVESTDAATYDMHIQQVMVLPNLWDDPGFETGTAVTNVGTPTTSAQDAGQAHSGSNSWKIVSDATDEGFKRAIATTSGKWYMVTGWIYADTAGTVDMVAGGTTVITSVNDAFEKMSIVFLADAASEDVFFLSNGSQTFYVDDVSVIELDDVSITATAASEANSTEDGGLRVDGLDTCTQPIPAGVLGPTSGSIKFYWTPRHGAGDFEKFGNTDEFIAHIYNNANNEIWLYNTGAGTTTMRLEIGGVATSGNYASTVVAGTRYFCEIRYTSTQCLFFIDNAIKITVTPGAGIDFGANIPNIIYMGSKQTGAKQSDAVFT